MGKLKLIDVFHPQWHTAPVAFLSGGCAQVPLAGSWSYEHATISMFFALGFMWVACAFLATREGRT